MANVQIYQLLVRHFGNSNTTRKPHGSIVENGCGKFNDISTGALLSIKEMGFTHVWLTGVLEHASGTSYPGDLADPEVLLKGKAGSPYAVKDYFDVSSDLACDVSNRLGEFEALLDRVAKAGLVSMIDFVPNHVSRSYQSDVRPDVDFGTGDDRNVFFHKDNNFFYLDGDGPLVLPSGEYLAEAEVGKVTGNNAVTWQPTEYDWYETVKLNYGHDFRLGGDVTALEHLVEVPDTWKKMDEVLVYWQKIGVKGFRCDMAHMVPMAFWKWAIAKARSRDSSVYITGEAYDQDPMKLGTGNVLHELLSAGFDSVYDSETYDVVKGVYERGKWANDIDEVLWDEKRLHQMLRYVENHDEVRVASPRHWGGFGSKVGMAASAILLGIGRGDTLLYSGQEVGEPAEGSEGYCSDNGRTSIFDYWSLPELCKWANNGAFDGGGLSDEQTLLRFWYANFFNTMKLPVFSCGGVYGLNGGNLENESYGRLGGETSSGHWLYGFLRYTENEVYIVLVNMHPVETMIDVVVELPESLPGVDRWSYNLYKSVKIESCEVIIEQLELGGI